MRKILNKKGFTLQEIMIVVFILGLLLTVAVPSYKLIQTNAENKECGTNIEMIQLAVVEYYNSNQVAPTSLNDLKPFLDEDADFKCPKSNADYDYYYGVAAVKNADGTYTGQVICPCPDTDDDRKHEPKGAVESFSGTYVVLQESEIKKVETN